MFEMDHLLYIPRLSSYQSCIKFHSKPILPPLLSNQQKNEIEEIRKRAALIEKQIRSKNTNKQELGPMLNTFLDTEEVCQNSSNSGNSDVFKLLSGDTLPFFNASNSSILNGICEEEEEISVISIDTNPPEEKNETKDRKQSLSGIDDLTPESFPTASSVDPSPLFNGNSFPVLTPDSAFEFATDYFGIQNFQKSIDASSKKEISEPEDAECSSLITIIANDDLNTSPNTDNNSIAQSSDLEKYFDCGGDDVESSGQSTALEQDIDLLLSFSSSETIVDCSVNSTPIVPSVLPLFKRETNLIDSLLDFDITPDSPVTSSMPVAQDLSFEIASCVEPSKSNTPSPDEVKAACERNIEELVNIDVLHKPHGHKRSNSYTIEVPSPVLLESHANCPCLKSPTGSLKPHCSWVNTESSFAEMPRPTATVRTMSDVPVRCHANPFSVAKDLTQIESSNENLSLPEETPPVHQDASQHTIMLRDLIEDFKTNREQRVELLLQEQHRQWEKLNQELKLQEQDLNKQMSALNLRNTEDGKASENDTLVSLDSSATKPEDCQDERHSNETKQVDCNCHSLGSTYTLRPKTASDCSLEKPPTIEDQPCVLSARKSDDPSASKSDLQHRLAVMKAINDPVMQKKFEKVSAVAKGFLTRRLLNSALIQTIKAKIVDIAMEVEIFQQRFTEGLTADEIFKYHGDLIPQLNKSFNDIHYIFFETTPAERMNIISVEGRKQRQPFHPGNFEPVTPPLGVAKRKLSAATLKRLERKGSSKERTVSNEKLWKNDDNHRLKKASSARNISSQKKSRDTVPRTKSTSPPRSCCKNRVKRNCSSSATVPFYN